MNNDLNMNKIDDTISRRAVIEALGEKPVAWSKGEYERGLQNQWGYDISAIKQLPSVQPERIKGRWIEIALTNHTYKCSVCGRLLVNITDGKNNVTKNYPYCHCGADMRGEQK